MKVCPALWAQEFYLLKYKNNEAHPVFYFYKLCLEKWQITVR